MTERPSKIRYRVVFWLALASTLAYLCRNSVGVAESQLRAELGLTLQHSGWLMGAFFWTYALFQVPTGSFAQRFGSRNAMTFFAFLWGIAMLATAVSPLYGLLIVAQLCMGFAQAGYLPASTNSINYWMPMSQRSFACGLLSVGMQVGAISASLLTGYLLGFMTWRWAFAIVSIPSLLWAIIFYIRFRDRPEQCAAVNAGELEKIYDRPPEQAVAKTEVAGPTNWGEIAKHPVLWLICGQQVCRAAGYMFFASWFPTFLQQTRGVSIAESGVMQGTVFAGTLAGSLIGGMVADGIWRRTGNLRASRSGVGAIALGGCSLLILAGWFVEDARLAVGLLSLGALFAALAGPCMFATVIDISGSRVPQIFGVVNMSGNLAVAACPILVGMLFEQTENWDLVLLLFAGLYFVGAICWAFVDPRINITVSATQPEN